MESNNNNVIIYGEDVFLEKTVKKILDQDFNYRKPGILVVGYMTNFILEALAPYLMSSDERSSLPKEGLLKKCSDYLAENMKDDQNFISILSMLLVSPYVNTFLIPAIELCFPGVNPRYLENKYLAAIVYILLFECFVSE